ncbi:hypothetical protein CYLTODRAFT_231368 [Cylindrobasidium torrendii FP15055 ss-10]|uniref:RGS domain-containing protein n=1 Tax=Cylindrobasidium torrendii FP15055 ss-10 TaxID=1314674 RepID=A0A0D7ATI5_9AGAR|nr:hypothetical protein CYLTODRAFT_231368 [Cylindrobasidium torrendii FP15055 ss-10]
MSPSDNNGERTSGRRATGWRERRAYLPTLFPLAEKLNAKRLASVTLEQILAGGTCFPIGLPDFELYLAYNMASIEQLQFVVWYRDYRKRIQERVLRIRTETNGSFVSTSTETKRSLTGSELEPMVFDIMQTSGVALHDAELRDECLRVVATFLLPNSPKCLNTAARTRETIIQGLESTCHYELFESLYESTYAALEEQVLPRFLAHALSNMNMPKQLLWYALGMLVLATAVLGAALMIHFIPPPESNRAYRLITLLPLSSGIIMLGAALTGFCAQSHRRGARQIHTWELQQVNEEAARYVASFRSKAHDMPQALVCNSTDGSYSGKALPVTQRRNTTTKADIRLTRPAFFGPEQVIEDKTVLKAHRRLMNDLITLAVCCDLVFAIIILSIPGHST